MTALYQRRCTLVLVPPVPGSIKLPSAAQGIQIKDLRIQFKIEKSIRAGQPNTAEIQVFNLAQTTRALLQSRGTLCILMAGYGNNQAQIFSGTSRTIDHIRQGADWTSKIQCGDGERNIRFGVVAQSFKPGALVADAAKAAVQAMLVDPGNASAQLAKITTQYVSGFAMQGRATLELQTILDSQGMEYSIQDGRMQILEKGKPTLEGAVVLNAQSGLIGSPEHGTPEVLGGPGLMKIKTLLNPLVTPGRTVFLQSLELPAGGRFRAENVRHNGDTNGGEFYTECDARAL